MKVIHWADDPTKARKVVGVCKVCDRDFEPLSVRDPHLVSPSGLVHHGEDGGMTACGRDATGPEWWWKR